MQNFIYLKTVFLMLNILMCCNGNLKDSYSTLQFGYRLFQRMIESYMNYSILDCVEECLRTTRCKSVNYYRGATFCEKNFESNTTEPAMYRQDSGWMYTDIKNWDKVLIESCSDLPCKMTEKCIHKEFGEPRCVLSDCGIPIPQENTTWNVQEGDGIGIYKQMDIKCLDSFEQRGSGAIVCRKDGTWKTDLVCQVRRKDCKNLLENGQSTSGVYEIYPYGTSSCPVRVYCDMETMDGGWTVIQKRVNGSLSFERTWTEYKDGFGDPEENVWIGNDVIYQLTKEKNSSLYVSITLVNGSKLYELYDQFSVSNELEKYKLFLAGNATGTLGDRMLNTGDYSTNLFGMYFSTLDRDNDRFNGYGEFGSNCAAVFKGGWWYNACHDAFLNGPWYPGYWRDPWKPTVTSSTSVRGTVMMIKRH